MLRTAQTEKHFRATDAIRDIVIGMSDGLTVPFALAAGLSGTASIGTRIIVTAGVAEIAAGSIAMGLGGYLAARGDAEHYENERRRERQEVVDVPEMEVAEVQQIFQGYGLTRQQIAPVVETFRSRPEDWVDFMMKFELGLDRPDPRRALRSALTIAGPYVVGGLIPLTPYAILSVPREGLKWSASVTLAALLAFGYVKGRFTGTRPVRGALHTALIGGAAAAAAFLIARIVSGAAA